SRHQRGGDDDVGLQRVVVNQLFLAADVALAQFLGVAPGVLRVLDVHIELDELRAEAFYLLFDDRTGIERLDDGTDAPRRRDRLESGDSGTDNENPRRSHGSGASHHHREEILQLEYIKQHQLILNN